MTTPFTPTQVPAHSDQESLSIEPKPVLVTLDADRVSALGIHTAICPQCGLNPVTVTKTRRLQYTPSWVYLSLLANFAILLVLYFAFRKIVRCQIGLCDDCQKADSRGRFLRSASVLGAIFAPFVLGLSALYLFGETAGVAAGAGLVAGVMGSMVTHKRTKSRIIGVTHIYHRKFVVDGKVGSRRFISLRVNETFPRVLGREAPNLLAFDNNY